MIRLRVFLSICTTGVLAVSLWGCASYPDVNLQRLSTLPQHYSQFDAVLAWEVKRAGSETVIDGVFKNVRYNEMDGIEVWVAALDSAGKTVARSASYIMPHMLGMDAAAPFSLKLPLKAVSGSKLRFTYRYTALEGGGNDGGVSAGNWMQSFDAEVPGRQ